MKTKIITKELTIYHNFYFEDCDLFFCQDFAQTISGIDNLSEKIHASLSLKNPKKKGWRKLIFLPKNGYSQYVRCPYAKKSFLVTWGIENKLRDAGVEDGSAFWMKITPA